MERVDSGSLSGSPAMSLQTDPSASCWRKYLRHSVSRWLPSTLKSELRFLLGYPRFLWRLIRNYLYDLDRFRRWSSAGGRTRRYHQLRSWLIGDYHKIEKGLSLKAPKLGFGLPIVRRLIANLKEYRSRYGHDRLVEVALGTLWSYYQFHHDHGFHYKDLYRAIEALGGHAAPSSAEGGVRTVTREEILTRAHIDLRSFFSTRHSIRNFASSPVDFDLIRQAIAMAQKTPTVCNRQSLRVYAFSEPQAKLTVLSCQQGNAGFGHQAAIVLIVTSELQTFFHVGERNQCWIDGGMFSMSLVYALHSLGLGTCCLNWSADKQRDRQLRATVGIPDSQAVIMMIAVGHLPEVFQVAQSPRFSIDEVLRTPNLHETS